MKFVVIIIKIILFIEQPKNNLGVLFSLYDTRIALTLYIFFNL